MKLSTGFSHPAVLEKRQSAGISRPAFYVAVSLVLEQRRCLVSVSSVLEQRRCLVSTVIAYLLLVFNHTARIASPGIAYLLLVSNHTARISTRLVMAVGPAPKLLELATQSGSDDAGGIGKMEPFS